MTQHEPCRCDPVFSGEEHCNGGCELREQISTLETRLAEYAAFLVELKTEIDAQPLKIAKHILDQGYTLTKVDR